MATDRIAGPSLRLAWSALRMPSSGIRAASDLAAGIPGAVHLEIGQPDIGPPPEVIDAATAAAEAGYTGYAPNEGLPELREEIAATFGRRGSHVRAEQITVTQGGTQGVSLVLAALLNPADEILIPDPGWPNYAMAAVMLGARPVRYPLNAANGYQPSASDIASRIGRNTSVLVLNSPSNPLGMIIQEENLRAVLELAAKHGLWVLSDECYEDIVFGVRRATARDLADDESLITVHSFSKSYSMTGFRIGYVVAPPRVAVVLAKLQEAYISSVNTPSQYAALAALRTGEEFVRQSVATYRHRRDAVLTELSGTEISFARPEGAFYVWITIPQRLGELSSRDVAAHLLRKTKVALAPGESFGDNGNGYLRMSLLAPEETLMPATKRLAEAIQRMRP
jgi:aspartate aminotransferase